MERGASAFVELKISTGVTPERWAGISRASGCVGLPLGIVLRRAFRTSSSEGEHLLGLLLVGGGAHTFGAPGKGRDT